MTSGLEICRGAATDVEHALRELPTRLEREPRVGAGEGGDDTTAIDAAAEAAVVARLEAAHANGTDFVLVSEELGERRFGPSPVLHVVVDPIDGSVNAKRGIPFFSLSIAIAEGPTMGDVTFGYVRDFGSGEEWTAERGGGARLNGEPIPGPGPKDPIELLSFEATMTHFVASKAAAFLELAPRLRIMGSLALSLCHLAAGRVDGVVSLKAIRSVDIAAGQLLLREQGLAIDLPALPSFLGSPLDVGSHSRVVAARTPALCAQLAGALGE
jgi:myo-inositol-1(or 4)-monophosphatase